MSEKKAGRPDFLAALERLRVVLVDPKFPPNLGAVARAMKNMGVSDLRLVHPRAELNKAAYVMALGASDILDRGRFHGKLLEAVADCGLVIGTTRRTGTQRRNLISPRAAAELLRSVLLSGESAALVFGSEDVGLANEHVALCHGLVQIHTGTGFESLNLSHAVALVLWEINVAFREWQPPAQKLASATGFENLIRHGQEALIETGFLRKGDPKRMMLMLRQVLHRANLTEREVRILRGILRQTQWRIKHPEKEAKPRP